ncbi:MAG: flagellar transcriptional regulator FlhC [Betaproteobacteria bacterium]|nr:flagellar transcriptional regulator FlhC [Betaproteobacteria bacterium]
MLEYAAACAEQGAHTRTISLLTGIPLSQLRAFFRQPLNNQRGRHPDTREWYYNANLLSRVEASLIVSIFRRLIKSGLEPPLALLGAYRHYSAHYPAPLRISFDRAFDLAAHATRRWIADTTSFSVVACPDCHCEYLTSVTNIVPCHNNECPFCKLIRRYILDTRIQTSYPTHPPPGNVLLLGIRSISIQSWTEGQTLNLPK